jgi:hypothetical protein
MTFPTSEIQGQAKPVVRVTVRRIVRVAVRRPAIHRVIAPTATTEHAEQATANSNRIFDVSVIIRRIPVMNPLEQISMNVEQPS